MSSRLKIDALIVIEFIAVIFSLLYTFLYLRSNPWCFLFGILGPLLFIFLCYRKKLFAETFLQAFYVLMAIYGWVNVPGTWSSDPWTLQTHLLWIALGALLVLLVGSILRKKTTAQLPFIDTFTTVFGIIGTWAMIHFIHENWLYFIAINTVSILMYTWRKMYMTGLMYILYLIMAIDGYFTLGIFTS